MSIYSHPVVRRRCACSAWTTLLLAPLLALGIQAGELPPLGGEFQINTYTPNAQQHPAVAIEPDGDFVVAWTSNGSSGTDISSYSVLAQRFASDGATLGDEIQVNSFTTGRQWHPSVGVDDAGDFVVVWHSDDSTGSDSSQTSVQARRFTSDGTALGDEFQVNSYTTDRQEFATIGMDADGDFIIVWQSDGSSDTDTDSRSVQAQRFASDGTRLGEEMQVNSYTTSQQWLTSVGVEPDGDFVVVWTGSASSGTDASSVSVHARRFASDGGPISDEFQVNRYTTDAQHTPVVAVESDGDFVIAWSSDGSSGDDTYTYSVQTRRFASDGGALGDEFQVNTYTPDVQRYPTVGVDSRGDFVVAWMSFGPGTTDQSDYSIQVQRYASNGGALGGEVQVNTYVTGFQHIPVIGVDIDGDFVLVWESTGSSGSDTDPSSIQGQLYSVSILSDGFESGDTSGWSITVQ